MKSFLCQYYEPFEFTAPWISCKGADVPNCSIDFFTEFEYSPAEEVPLLRIAAESYYILHINGIFTGRGPVRGTWNSNYFDTYDLSTLLHEGKNRISVQIHSMNSLANFNTHPAGCALLAEIPGILQTGENWRARLKPGWRHSEVNFAFQQGFKIEYDLTLDDGDSVSGRNAADWQPAILFTSLELERKKLLPRGIPPLQESVIIPKLVRSAAVEVGTIAPGEDIADLLNHETWYGSDNISSCGENEFVISPGHEGAALVFDFGKPCNGFFEVDIEAASGTRLDISCGEELWNGRVRASYRESNCGEIFLFTDTYFLKDGSSRIGNFFCAHGGSMVQLVFRNITGEIKVRQPHFLDRRYPYREAAKFSCSDIRLNQIWKACRETISACTTDTFEDCPWREHAFWANDLVVENLTSTVLFGTSDIHRRSLELIFDQQYDSGWCTAVIPVKYDPEKPSNILPATNFFFFIIMADYYRESGDIETVRRYLPNLEKILHAAERECQDDGLIQPPEHSWNFYDWCFELNLFTFNHQRDSMLNSLYIIAMKEFCRLCDIAEVPCDKKLFASRIARTSAGLQKRLEEGGGVFMDPVCRIILPQDDLIPDKLASELSLGFALQSGIWDEEQQRKFVDKILSGTLLQPELYLSGMVFMELTKAGHAGEVLRRIRKYWGKVVDLNLPTIPEAGVHKFCREAFRETGTYCHGFATYPVHFCRQVLLGVSASEPGYKVFEFAPQPLDLTFADGDIHTPCGTIKVRWDKLANDELQVRLSVPSGCQAKLRDGRSFAAGWHEFTMKEVK